MLSVSTPTSFSDSALQDLVGLMQHAVVIAAAQMSKTLTDPENVKVWRKPDQSLLLNIDLESQETLKKILGDVLPIVSEEDPASHALIGQEEDYFVLDPLDGTTSCKRFTDIQGGQLGFGPLAGLVVGGIVTAAVFYHLPRRALFTATQGGGATICSLPTFNAREMDPAPLRVQVPARIEDSAILFYPGSKGELRLIEYLRSRDLVENAYRFGGFANDCSRLASGFEQLQVQFSVKAWDFPATLFPAEAGLRVIVDPLGKPTPSHLWKLQGENPILTSPPSMSEGLLKYLGAALNQERKASPG
jgi:fructose-1,6-bisphosphatase/inositol monophosphatase family enzyme